MNLVENALFLARADEGDFDEGKHPRDEKGMFTVVASGNTFDRKEKLKGAGFKWHAESKTWRKQVELTRKEADKAHISAKTFQEGTPEHAEQKALRERVGSAVMFKDIKLELHDPGYGHKFTAGKVTIHHGSELKAKESAQQERSSVSERNREMHVALGHAGYQRIPGSAPDDWH